MALPADERRALPQQLATLVARYGTGLLDDPQQLGAVVADLAPGRRAERSVLRKAAAAGTAGALRAAAVDGSVPGEVVLQAGRDLAGTGGAIREAADWAVQALLMSLQLVEAPPGETGPRAGAQARSRAERATPAPAPAPLSALLDAVAAGAVGACEGPAREAVEAVRRRLAEPLRVTVVGRVSSGKSTLLNALVGRRVAATAVGECTRTTAEYRYGRYSTARAVLRDGSSLPVPAPRPGALVELPVPAEDVQRLEVTENLHPLRDLTLVDTPGLASAGGSDTSSRTEQLLTQDSLSSAEAADALLFVLNGPVKDDEQAAVEAFRRASRHAPAATALAVLTKADRLSADPRQSWTAARDLADRIALEHRSLFAAVVPVVGLLAETGCLGLAEQEAADLRALAESWDDEDTALALSDAELFCTLAAPVPEVRRRALLQDRLDLFGAGELLTAVRDGRARTAHALSDLALEVSGLPHLRQALGAEVTARADALKAGRALAALEAASYLPGASAGLRDDVERLQLSDDLLPVRLAQARAVVSSGRVSLPTPLADQLADACAPGGPGVADGATVSARIAEWKRWALLTSEAGRRVADAMVEALQAQAAS